MVLALDALENFIALVASLLVAHRSELLEEADRFCGGRRRNFDICHGIGGAGRRLRESGRRNSRGEHRAGDHHRKISPHCVLPSSSAANALSQSRTYRPRLVRVKPIAM